MSSEVQVMWMNGQSIFSHFFCKNSSTAFTSWFVVCSIFFISLNSFSVKLSVFGAFLIASVQLLGRIFFSAKKCSQLSSTCVRYFASPNSENIGFSSDTFLAYLSSRGESMFFC